MAGAKDQDASTFQNANDQFSSKMLSEAVKANSDKSVVISAFSVLTPLSLLSTASEGVTHEEILKTLGFENDEALKQALPSVTSELRSAKGIDIKMANRIYIPTGYELADEFADSSRAVFDSEVKNADFVNNTEKTISDINSWVETQTNDKIHDLVGKDQVNVDTKAVLVNALYFKGLWDKPFKKLYSRNGTFHKSKSATAEVTYMFMKDDFKYTESSELNAKILELPYAGNEASFLIILPNEVDGLAAVEEKIRDPQVLNKATARMATEEVHVKIPKFKIETKTDLVDVLQKMGIKTMFGSGAQITKLLKTKIPLTVSSATQKAFIEVNEEGTEAAAANEFGIAYLSAFVPERKLEFVADHPFIFMVMQKKLILFSGIYRT